MKIFKLIIPLLLLLNVYSCQDSDLFGRYYGEETIIGNSTAKSFVVFNENGIPISIGIEMAPGSLENLPLFDKEYILELPDVDNETAFHLIGLDWNTHGHDPEGLYNVPHFDVHFYIIGQEERDGIIIASPEDDSIAMTPPEAQYLAEDYVGAPNSALPGMGSHWVDTLGLGVNQEGFFSQTIIYGFHNGSMTFIEPMASLAWLSSPKNVSNPIKQPAEYEKPGYYPTTYRVWVKEDGTVIIELEDMVLH